MTGFIGTPSTALTLANPWALVPALGNLDAYISAVNRMPMLTLEEEQSFARKFRIDNDLEAAGKLVDLMQGRGIESLLRKIYIRPSLRGAQRHGNPEIRWMRRTALTTLRGAAQGG